MEAWHLIRGFTLGDIPWEVYVAASFAAATAIVIALPSRLGLALGLLAALVLGDIGFTAKGYHEGAADRDAWWAKQAAAERERLQDQLTAVLKAETARADAAEAKNQELQGRVNDAEQAVPTDANGNPVVIPPDLARKLWAITPAAARSGADRPAVRAFGPFPLPGLLRLHR